MIILVHGFYRNKKDMSYLENQLNSLGYKTFVANLPTTYGTIDEMVSSLANQLETIVKKDEQINFVAHSMGGLIVREYINTHKKSNIGKCIFIATPHRGSTLANMANRIPLLSSIFKPLKELATTYKYTPFENKTFDLGLIAGDKNSDLLGRILMHEESDGRVAVNSVKTKDADDFILLHFGHNTIHKREDTLNQVVSFLENSRFNHKN